MRPAPKPYPRDRKTTSRQPTAAPSVASPIAARRSSLSMATGRSIRASRAAAKSNPSRPGRSGDRSTRPASWSTMPEIPATIARTAPGRTVMARSSMSATRSPSTALRSLGSRVGRASRPRIVPCRSASAALNVRPPASTPITNPESSSSSTSRGGRPTPIASIEYSRRTPPRRSRSTTRPTVAADRPVASASSARDARGRSASISRIATVESDIPCTMGDLNGSRFRGWVAARSTAIFSVGVRCYHHADENFTTTPMTTWRERRSLLSGYRRGRWNRSFDGSKGQALDEVTLGDRREGDHGDDRGHGSGSHLLPADRRVASEPGDGDRHSPALVEREREGDRDLVPHVDPDKDRRRGHARGGKRQVDPEEGLQLGTAVDSGRIAQILGDLLEEGLQEPGRKWHGKELVDERQADLRVIQAELLVQHVHGDNEEELGRRIGQQQPEPQPAPTSDPEAHHRIGRRRRDQQRQEHPHDDDDDAVDKGV